jgi:hypothetical protein
MRNEHTYLHRKTVQTNKKKMRNRNLAILDIEIHFRIRKKQKRVPFTHIEETN